MHLEEQRVNSTVHWNVENTLNSTSVWEIHDLDWDYSSIKTLITIPLMKNNVIENDEQKLHKISKELEKINLKEKKASKAIFLSNISQSELNQVKYHS